MLKEQLNVYSGNTGAFVPANVLNVNKWMNRWPSLPPCSQYVTIRLMCQMKKFKVQKNVGDADLARENGTTEEWKRLVWISKTGNGQLETRQHTLVCRRWQNDQWEYVGGSCREMHSFCWQVCVGWWLPVLLLLYTLVCKPPLTSGCHPLKLALQTRFYAIALMWYCIL